MEIAKGIGFRSTPTIIINDQLIPGFIGYDQVTSIMNSNNTVTKVNTEKDISDNEAVTKADTITNVSDNADVAKVDTKNDNLDVKSNVTSQDNDNIDSKIDPTQKKQ